MTTWVPLMDAFERVLRHERDRYVAERLLRHALADGRVRSRGYIISAAENMAEPLPRSLFTFFEDEHTTTTTFDIEANSIRHTDGWYGDKNCVVRRVEIAREDIIKVWPEHAPAQVGLRRGRKRQYDYEQILREADADVAENAPPRSRKEWFARVAKRLEAAGEPAPGHTLMMQLLGPKYRSFR